MRWLICLGAIGLGALSWALGAIVGAKTHPQLEGQWERFKASVRPTFERPSLKTILWLTPLFLMVVVLGLSFTTSPYDYQLKLANGVFVGIGDGRISFFNTGADGPYSGSIVALTDGVTPPKFDRAWFDFPGIYYRWFDFRPGIMWALTFSLLIPLAIAAIPAELWLIGRVKRRRMQSADELRRPFQFRLRDALHGTFWFCAAAALLSHVSTGRSRAPVEFYSAIVAAGIGIGVISKHLLAAVLISSTIVSPFVLVEMFDRFLR
jgi:hypothetical protein